MGSSPIPTSPTPRKVVHKLGTKYYLELLLSLVVFHVATLMPTLTSDPQCSNKKLHIGNDFVTIVFNESGLPYQFGTIKVSPSPHPQSLECSRAGPVWLSGGGGGAPACCRQQSVCLCVRRNGRNVVSGASSLLLPPAPHSGSHQSCPG